MDFIGCSVSAEYGNLSKPGYSDLMMYHCGTQKCAPAHYWSGVRDHFLIHYILSGKGTFIINNVTYHLSKGQGFLICPDTLSFYQADLESPWHYCWVGFQGTKAEYYLKQVNLSMEQPIFTYTSDDSLSHIMLQMVDAKNVSVGRNFLLTGLLYQFFSKLAEIGYLSEPTIENQNPKEVYVSKAVDFIYKNYSRKITISEISDYVGIDRKYLSSIFKDVLHTSPQDFLIKYRLDKACILLVNNLLSIRDVAHSVGYEDPLLFSKMFKKIKGMSPRQYRKRMLGKL